VLKKHIGLNMLWVAQALLSACAQIAIANYYGTGAGMDTYLVGTTLVTILFAVFAGTFSQTAVAEFSRISSASGEQAALGSTGLLALSGFLLGSCLFVFIAVFASELLALFDSALAGSATHISVLRISALGLPFLFTSVFLGAALQAQGKFFVFTAAAVMQSVLVPFFVLAGLPADAVSLAYGFLLAAVVPPLFQIVSVGARSLRCRIADFNFRPFVSASRESFPVLLGSLMIHAVWFRERQLAFMLGDGYVSSLGYAQRVLNLVSGGIGYGVMTVSLPLISSLFFSGNHERIKSVNRGNLAVYSVLGLLSFSFIWFFAEDIIGLLFARGRFDANSIGLTSTAIKMYFGLYLFNILGGILSKSVFALKETRLYLLMGGATLAVYLVVSGPLVKYMGFPGIPLSASLAFIVQFSVMAFQLKARHKFIY